MTTAKKYTHISCFDLDHTLLTSTSSFRFGIYLYQNRVFPTSTMLYLVACYWLHKIRAISMTQMQHRIFNTLFRGTPLSKMLDYATDFIENTFDSMLFHPAVQRLQAAQKQGHYTVILSSSPLFLVEMFAKRFHVDAWDGTRYELDHTQCFSSISHLMQGDDKALYLKNLKTSLKLTTQQTTAYSDSILDYPLLNAAGTAVGVNPDKKLRKLCLIRKWQILS